MKKVLTTCMAIMMIAMIFTGCGEPATYEDIYAEYSSKIEETAPKLVEEFKTEAEELKGDVMALADLSNEKVSELAEISVEGTGKMAELQLKNGDETSLYMEWAEKLNAVYMENAELITDAYLETAAG